MKCPNCGNNDFREVELYSITILSGYGEHKQLCRAFGCVNCNRVEIYMPEDWGKCVLADERKAEIEKQEEEKRKKQKEIEKLRQRMADLEAFLHGNHTLKEFEAAQNELAEIKNKYPDLKPAADFKYCV